MYYTTYYTRYSPCNASRTVSSTYYKKALMIFIGFGMVNNYRTLPLPRSSDLVLLPRLVLRMSTSTMREKRARTWWRRPRTKVPNNKNPPKNNIINSGKMTGHDYAWNNLTCFEYAAHAINGNENDANLLKLICKNSWNHTRWTYFWRVLVIWNLSVQRRKKHLAKVVITGFSTPWVQTTASTEQQRPK